MLTNDLPTMTVLEAAWADQILNAWIYVMCIEHADDRRFAEVVDLGGES